MLTVNNKTQQITQENADFLHVHKTLPAI